MLEAAVAAAQQLFTPGPILGMLIVLPIALLSGLMPASGLPVRVVVLSLVSVLDPWVALTVVVFHSAANDITEPVPAILLGVPGSRSAQATVLDGYPMARQGRAGEALGASYVTTLIGGTIGAVALLISLPIGRWLLQFFGSAEFFLLALMGVMAVAIVSAGAYVKGMLTAMFGMSIAMIGYSPIEGVVRANFGINYFWDGVPLIPIIVGLFALPEAIDLVVADTPIASNRLEKMLADCRRDVWRGMRTAFQHKWLITRSSLVGTFVGMLPALGGSVAHWIAYAQARATEKGAKETFGHGDIRGVIASDAANNSSDGGELIPTVVFGIPGSGGMALILAMLILYGIKPGPDMLNDHLDLTMSLVYVLVLGNVLVVPVMLAASPLIARATTIPPNLITPVVIAIVTLSAYMATYSLGDLLTALAFGVLGVFMKRYGWPRPPILIAVVLGGIVEQYMYSSLAAYGASMLLRPQFLSIAAFMILIVLGSLRMQRGAGQVASASSQEVSETGRTEGAQQEKGTINRTQRKQLNLEIIGEIILLIVVGTFFLYMFILSLDWSWGARLTPQLVIGIGTPFLILRIIHVLRVLFWSTRVSWLAPSQIMDMGFRVSDDPKGEGKRWIRILCAIAALNLGIWLAGFHIALPLWVIIYMVWFGRANLFVAGGIALLFLGLILGVYDYLIRVPWHDPILIRLFTGS